MRTVRPITSGLVCAALLLSGVATAQSASAAKPAKWKNCTAVHKYYPHGVGKAKARDRTSGKPVTTFKRSNALYATAMKYNKGLDRDKDGIACEQR